MQQTVGIHPSYQMQYPVAGILCSDSTYTRLSKWSTLTRPPVVRLPRQKKQDFFHDIPVYVDPDRSDDRLELYHSYLELEEVLKDIRSKYPEHQHPKHEMRV